MQPTRAWRRGQAIDDWTITSYVKAKLANEAPAGLGTIGVETSDGVVRLTGVVATAERQQAGQIVRGVKASVTSWTTSTSSRLRELEGERRAPRGHGARHVGRERRAVLHVLAGGGVDESQHGGVEHGATERGIGRRDAIARIPEDGVANRG